MIDVLRARQDTPGCERVLHFNNAGAALMPKQVLDAVTRHLRLEAEIGGYESAESEHDRVERVYDAISLLIGCQPDEIAIIENATRAEGMVFCSLRFQSGDRILTPVLHTPVTIFPSYKSPSEPVPWWRLFQMMIMVRFLSRHSKT